jgi:hypothetical protein
VIDEPYCRVCMAFAGAENNVRGEWKPVGFRRLSALGANAIPPSFVCPYCHKSVPLRFQRVIAVTSDWQPVEWACRRCELAMVPFPLWSYRGARARRRERRRLNQRPSEPPIHIGRVTTPLAVQLATENATKAARKYEADLLERVKRGSKRLRQMVDNYRQHLIALAAAAKIKRCQFHTMREVLTPQGLKKIPNAPCQGRLRRAGAMRLVCGTCGRESFDRAVA